MSGLPAYRSIVGRRLGLTPEGLQVDGLLINGKNHGGRMIYCDPGNGTAGRDMYTPLTATDDIEEAYAAATANQNDVVVLIGTTNASTPTTARVSEGGLAWAKDNVHLIGVCSGNHMQQRARISHASSGDTASTFVLNVTADNCMFANFSTFLGHGGTVTTPTSIKVTGGTRNAFYNVSMSGIGNDANDVADASSLWLSAAGENYFEKCSIGLTTTARGTADCQEIWMSSGCARNYFRDCYIHGWASASTYSFVEVEASGVQDVTVFDNCAFVNAGVWLGPGATIDEAFGINDTNNGGFLLHNCSVLGATAWEATSGATNRVYTNLPAANAAGGEAVIAKS